MRSFVVSWSNRFDEWYIDMKWCLVWCLPGGMMKSRKAMASSASACSLRTILTRCRAAHVFDDNPPDLAVMPRSVGVRASWRHTPTVPPATTGTSWARRASLAEPHWPFQRTKTRQCTAAAAPRQHSRYGLRSVLWPCSAGRLRIGGGSIPRRCARLSRVCRFGLPPPAHTAAAHGTQTGPEAQLQPHCRRPRLRNQPPWNFVATQPNASDSSKNQTRTQRITTPTFKFTNEN